MKPITQNFLKCLLLAAIIYMPLFGHLDSLPIRVWDESRLAINAFEMNKNGNFLVTYFENHPDMWNTKPPLLIWIQVLTMKIIGVNELAIRLPSAFAALFTCVVLLVFSIRFLKSFWFGIIAVIVLITSQGYVNFHATRTGDYDALLCLFTTLSGLFFFSYTETKKTKYLYFFFLSLTLSVLTKSIAGLMFLPAIGIYCLWQKSVLSLLKNKHFYIGLFAFLVLVLGYYYLRDFYNPGYIEAVKFNDLGGRYLAVLDGHESDGWFYYDLLMNSKFSYWFYFVPLGFIIGLFNQNNKLHKLAVFSMLMSSLFLIVISNSQTKLEWYDVPLYPYLALLASIFIYFIYQYIQNLTLVNMQLKWNVLPYVFLFFISLLPYQKILDKTYFPKESEWDADFYAMGYFLKDAIKGNQNVQNCFVLYDGYFAQNLFYINILNDKGININLKDWKKLNNGDQVISTQKIINDYLTENYILKSIMVSNRVTKYEIVATKTK